MTNTTISNHNITSDEIEPIIANIEEAVSGFDRNHIILALLCMVFVLSDPEVAEDNRLKTYVEMTSRYIALLLGTSEGATVN